MVFIGDVDSQLAIENVNFVVGRYITKRAPRGHA
jgi:hypothetical protein